LVVTLSLWAVVFKPVIAATANPKLIMILFIKITHGE
jgi:hypothetical protein